MRLLYTYLLLFTILALVFWLLKVFFPILVLLIVGFYLWYKFIGKKKFQVYREENISFYQDVNPTSQSHPDVIDAEYTEYEESDGSNE